MKSKRSKPSPVFIILSVFMFAMLLIAIVLLVLASVGSSYPSLDMTRTMIAEANSTTESLIQATNAQATQYSGATQVATNELPNNFSATATQLIGALTQDASLLATQQAFDSGIGTTPTLASTAQPQILATQGIVPTQQPTPLPPPDMFFEDYGVNPFLDTEDDNLSTFAMDVDTASYTLARNYLRDQNQLPPPDAIRPEEFINYFTMNYPSPQEDAFAIHLAAAPAPFGYDGHYLMQVGLQGRYVPAEERQPAILTFVIDVSGSMSGENRLGLVKRSLALLVDTLNDDDYVAIVTYADGAKQVLEPTAVAQRELILSRIDSLQTEGSTYAEAGLRLGYDIAKSVYRDGAINRVILLSDGVANVGETGPDGILQLVADHVARGITLSTIGVGMGNYNDVMMEQLANDGDGNYFYVDEIRQARRVFVHQLTSTLQVIAYDAKIQVEFHPDVTDRYRLIGYENRAIADEDFRNDTIDAGEIGAGHSVTALYELALENDADGTIATVYIRYQDADTREIVEVAQDITTADIIASYEDADPQWKLLAGIAELSELLRESFWAQDGSYDDLLAWIEPVQVEMINNGELIELIEMTHRARQHSQ